MEQGLSVINVLADDGSISESKVSMQLVVMVPLPCARGREECLDLKIEATRNCVPNGSSARVSRRSLEARRLISAPIS